MFCLLFSFRESPLFLPEKVILLAVVIGEMVVSDLRTDFLTDLLLKVQVQSDPIAGDFREKLLIGATVFGDLVK